MLVDLLKDGPFAISAFTVQVITAISCLLVGAALRRACVAWMSPRRGRAAYRFEESARRCLAERHGVRAQLVQKGSASVAFQGEDPRPRLAAHELQAAGGKSLVRRSED